MVCYINQESKSREKQGEKTGSVVSMTSKTTIQEYANFDGSGGPYIPIFVNAGRTAIKVSNTSSSTATPEGGIISDERKHLEYTGG
jgi:hypothetical protein